MLYLTLATSSRLADGAGGSGLLDCRGKSQLGDGRLLARQARGSHLVSPRFYGGDGDKVGVVRKVIEVMPILLRQPWRARPLSAAQISS